MLHTGHRGPYRSEQVVVARSNALGELALLVVFFAVPLVTPVCCAVVMVRQAARIVDLERAVRAMTSRPVRALVPDVPPRAPASEPTPEPAVAPACTFRRGAVVRAGARRYRVRPDAVDCLVETTSWERALRIVPQRRGGRVVGVMVVGVMPESVPWQLGLRDGDVLRRVNGAALVSPERCVAVYARLRPTGAVTLDLERRGRPVRLRYEMTNGQCQGAAARTSPPVRSCSSSSAFACPMCSMHA